MWAKTVISTQLTADVMGTTKIFGKQSYFSSKLNKEKIGKYLSFEWNKNECSCFRKIIFQYKMELRYRNRFSLTIISR